MDWRDDALDVASRYHGGGLIDTIIHSLAASLGWHAGTDLAGFLGPRLLLLLVGIIAVVYLWRRLKRGTRRLARATTRRGGRRR